MANDKHGTLTANLCDEVTKVTNPVKIQDLTFRDGHQSLFATRGRTEDFLPIAEDMDQVGFYSMEVWGGATFDTMHRFLGEDPWERIRTMKKYIKKTPFSMLLRAQNLVGYRNYADDVAVAFVDRSCENGIDIFRPFDALNDFRNFETVVPIIKKNKKHFQGAICYSLTQSRLGGPVYNLEYYLKKASELEDMGADTICVKDMYPSEQDRLVHVGRVEGPYRHDPASEPGYPHQRPVKWLTAIPRTRLSQGALYEIGSALSLFQVKNHADEYRALVSGKPAPLAVTADASVAVVADEIVQSTRDFVLKRLSQELKGHPLTEFVAHLLGTMGYKTRVSPEGPDGGVDIIAHRDELGFEPPLIKVQVKSGDATIGDPVVSALSGKVAEKEFGLIFEVGGKKC